MKKNYVFLYGTILREESNHHLIEDEEFIDVGVIQNFKMVDLGIFPGIIPGDGVVSGEIYLVCDDAIEMLDLFMAEGELFVRKTVKVFTSNLEYEAYVYIYNKEVKNPIYLGEKTYSWKNRLK